MHQRQASLAANASEIAARVAAKSVQSAAPGGQAYLWKYADPDGKPFYLEEKKMTIKSPFSGKSFSAKPVKYNLMQVGKEIKEDKAEAAATKTASDIWKV